MLKIFISVFILIYSLQAESLKEAGNRSGSILSKITNIETLQKGGTYTINWSVISYLDIDSNLVITLPGSSKQIFTGERLSRKKAGYSIGSNYSYEHKFTTTLDIPGYISSGTATVGFYTYRHEDTNDVKKGMYALIPAGVVERPSGLQGKQFFISIVGKSVELNNGDISTKWVDSPSYGTKFQTYMGVNAYANKSDYSGKYQCTELIKRFYKDIFNIEPFSSGNGRDVASKYGGKSGKYNNTDILLEYHKNSLSSEKPINGSIISFDTGNTIGHVAIVKKISCNSDTECSVYLFEQNWSYTDSKTHVAHSRQATFTKSNGKWSGTDGKNTVVGWTNPIYK